MSFADLFVGILIILLLVIAAVRVLSPRNAAGRKLYHDAQSKLVAIGGREQAAGQWGGRGTQTSAPLHLPAGAYRIDYQFDAPTRLALIDAGGGEDETLAITSGAGTTSFQVGAAGPYLLRVEPADEGAAWSVVYRQTD